VNYVTDAGAYASATPLALATTGGTFPGPYDIPNIRISGKALYTNNPISGACRGYGLPQAICATECQVDALSHELGIDPFEFRLKNALVAGKSKPLPHLIEPMPFITLDSAVSLPQTLMQAKQRAGPLRKPTKPSKKTARAVCVSMPLFDISGMPAGGMMGTGVSVELLSDGTAVVRSSAIEMGQGITTILAQIAAEELGLTIDRISVILGDTRATPKAGPTVASRLTYCCGNALIQATQEVRAVLLTEASSLLEAPEEILTLEDNRIYIKESPENDKSIQEITEGCYDKGLNLKGESWFATDHAGLGHTFTTVVADVEVDLETGEVEVLKLITAHDIGKAINPQMVEGQLVGGEVQGLGYVLMEDLVAKEGTTLTPNLLDYGIPTVYDIPNELQTILVEETYPTGPYGAKGVGEFGLDTVAPAILNAVYAATGIKFTDFPLTPQRVWEDIRRKKELQQTS
jgi:CO/xanthine dehydrogenase Mo-binding subunit